MPIYEYACPSCGKIHDVLQKVSDPAPTACATCGAQGPLTRMVSRTSFVLKGGGWYSDLYSSTKKEGASSSSSPGSSATPTSSSSSSESSSSTSTAPAAAASDKK